jgi:hypothetical protein
MWQRASFGGAACGAWMAQQWSRHSSHHAAMAEAAAAASSDGRILLHSAGWDAESRVDDKGKRGWWLSSAWCLIPHPDKVAKGGEDAAFGLEHAVGVADGVGGWASKGVDPGIYSKRLMVECHEAVARGEAAAAALPSPAALLRSAYDVVESEHILGSTTACVATLAPCEKGEDGWLLRSANLGDSGLMVCRPAGLDRGGCEVIYRVRWPLVLRCAGRGRGRVRGGVAPMIQRLTDTPALSCCACSLANSSIHSTFPFS